MTSPSNSSSRFGPSIIAADPASCPDCSGAPAIPSRPPIGPLRRPGQPAYGPRTREGSMTTPTTAEPAESTATTEPAETAAVGGRHRGLVYGSRLVLLMLLIAALAVLGLGVFFYLR